MRFQHRVEEPARLLGVTVGQQLHRALQVGEEDGDLLALAFEGRPGLQDLLDEVWRGGNLGGLNSHNGRWACRGSGRSG
jgi:hypothetical protein